MVQAADEALGATGGTTESLDAWAGHGHTESPGAWPEPGMEGVGACHFPPGIPVPPMMMPVADFMSCGPQDPYAQMPMWPPCMPPPFPGTCQDLSNLSREDLEHMLSMFSSSHAELTRQSNELVAHAAAHDKAARSKLEDNKKPRNPTNNKTTDVPLNQRTTLMLRNLPNDYKPEMLLELLNEKGLKNKYDFVYLPMDFQRKSGLGYAFVNMVSHEDADEAMSALDGYKQWGFGSNKVLQVAWATRQGLDTHLQFYKNNPVMHSKNPKNYKPMYFVNGILSEFPEPTKTLRPPRPKARGAKGLEK